MSGFLNIGLRLASSVAAASLVTTAALAGDIPPSSEVKETKKLSIASALDYAPFQYMDEKNEPVGIDIELQRAAAKLLGAELEILRTPFPSMIPGLAAGRFQVAWATYTPTAERLEQVHFVPYGKDGVVASTTPDKASSFSGENPLCGKRLGVAAGAAADFTADKINAECKAKGLPEIAKSVFPLTADVIQAVLSERIDARFDNVAASGYFQVTSGGQLVVVPGIYDQSVMAVAVTKEDPTVAEMMRAAIQELIDNGTYKTVLEKYGLAGAMIPETYIVRKIEDVRK